MLDVRRLRLLHELSLRGTVAATAEALHLTGPAVSQQLAALEKESGLRLLEKEGRTLRLTHAGRRLVEHADVILGSLAAADADLAALRSGRGGTVTVAVFPSAARVLMPQVWKRLVPDGISDPPDERVDLSIIESEPDGAVELLRRREADIAVVHAYTLLPRDLPPGCEQHQLTEEPVVMVLHPAEAARRALGPGDPVELADFHDAAWLMPGPQTSCHELIRRACGAAGFVPRPTALATDFSVLTALVAAGAGVAAVPRMALPADIGAVRLHPLATPVTRSISALTRIGQARQPQLARVLAELRAVAELPHDR